MGELRRLHRYTYAEYVAFETVALEKHEFLDGEIYAMAGGSEEHSALSAQVVRALGNGIAPPCRVHSSDLRIFVESVGLATYPDCSVICATALNPTVLVEVTSDSSEDYDTGLKLEYYQTIPTLRDYVIVSHRERRITVHTRGKSDGWETRVAGSEERVKIASLDIELAVGEIYRGSAL